MAIQLHRRDEKAFLHFSFEAAAGAIHKIKLEPRECPVGLS